MATVGGGDYRYEGVVDWAKLPAGWSWFIMSGLVAFGAAPVMINTPKTLPSRSLIATVTLWLFCTACVTARAMTFCTSVTVRGAVTRFFSARAVGEGASQRIIASNAGAIRSLLGADSRRTRFIVN